ncbi:hypothetical protein FHR81_005590 [Actinoalloteichus hoggarensis]|uniref:DUF5753 domain-containing protein n=2 Tax=Actinoalloteichus hoggarensis TaxID=1470176 RepID=A0A221W9C9_9PSEU|nr:hypothetical protein AHOG_21655 [Actinoalloteichus hoggarensis]MBB5924505.1 hypothetical protein [Actinoalloteichus hoggarensis]
MAEQITALINSTAVVRVLPIGGGAYPGMLSAFTLMTFSAADPVVYLEHLATGTYLDKTKDAGPYIRAVTTLDEVALSEDQTAATLARYQQNHAERSGTHAQ